NIDLVRFVDNREIERRRQRWQLAASIVDPDLDELRLYPGVVLDRGARFVRGGDRIRHVSSGRMALRPGAGVRDAGAGGLEQRRIRHDLVSNEERRVAPVRSPPVKV